jgi:uncharacterized protein YdeI (YjbR/CyaY-like superfamily)
MEGLVFIRIALMPESKPIRFFRSALEFRCWLVSRHANTNEQLIGFHKKHTENSGITYREALDEALCFGWIDGLRKRLDADRYMIRFTPRKARSIWSLVNIRRVADLTKSKRMAPAGIVAFKKRDPRRSGVYSFENRPREFGAPEEKIFKAMPKAWTFFSAQPSGYRRAAIWWVLSAKKDETRARRLKSLIADSSKGLRLSMLSPGGVRKP